jgi:valyl-tRNA synthetase
VEAGKKVDVIMYGGGKTKLLQEQAEIIRALAKLGNVTIVESGEAPENAATAVQHGVQVFVPLGDLVDLDEERRRLEGELEKARKYADTLRKKLDNESFVSKAPPQVVETEKTKLAEADSRIPKLEEQLKTIG